MRSFLSLAAAFALAASFSAGTADAQQRHCCTSKSGPVACCQKRLTVPMTYQQWAVKHCTREQMSLRAGRG